MVGKYFGYAVSAKELIVLFVLEDSEKYHFEGICHKCIVTFGGFKVITITSPYSYYVMRRGKKKELETLVKDDDEP